MPYFFSPKILYGRGMLKRFGNEISGRGTRAIVITDKVMAKASDQLVEAIKSSGYEVKVWDGAESDPSVEVAQAAGKALIEFGPQLVVGYGGGSAIDTAKAAWVLYENPEVASGEGGVASVTVRTKLNWQKKALFICVPTTSGTGSDVTWAIVLTDNINHRKIGFANNEIVPDISLLVPEFTTGMPKSLTASTGMDVLGHAIDGYTARQQNDFSDGLCLQAAKITFEWLPRACADGNNILAREKMQNAATIAGLGFGNSNTSLSHALGHAVGATFGIPHGRAIGIALPYSVEYISSNPPLEGVPDPVERLNTLARFIGIDAETARGSEDKLVAKIRDLSKETGEPLSLKSAGVQERQILENLDRLATLAGKDVNMFSCPCECKDENLKQLFKTMWEGK